MKIGKTKKTDKKCTTANEFSNDSSNCLILGCAPFPNAPGTIDKGNHISRLANKELKVLLSQCAQSAIWHNSELSAYTGHKIAEGKPKRVVINNVRNKLIQRIFAVVTSKVPYREDYLKPFAKCA